MAAASKQSTPRSWPRAKYAAFFLSGSSTLLAESLHSTSVTVNQALAIIGLAFAYAGVALVVVAGDAAYDAIASILVGCLLVEAKLAFDPARPIRHRFTTGPWCSGTPRGDIAEGRTRTPRGAVRFGASRGT